MIYKVFALLFLFIISAFMSQLSIAVETVDEPPLTSENWPTTLEAVVADILSRMSKEDMQTLKEMNKPDLIRLHHGWGTGIRNHYGLWRGNKALINAACNHALRCHPDDASMLIIERVWESLQNDN